MIKIKRQIKQLELSDRSNPLVNLHVDFLTKLERSLRTGKQLRSLQPRERL